MNKRRTGNWEYLFDDLDPDIALLQEASPLPDGAKALVRVVKGNHRTAIFTKANDHKRVKMHNDLGMGLLVAQTGSIFVISVYANLNFKPVHPTLLGLIGTYISVLRRYKGAEHIIIAGDFNMDRRMDDNPTGSKFASKGTYPTNGFFDTILGLGFFDCMRKFSDEPVQTHRHNRSEFPWELDHMFATKVLYDRLASIEVVNVDPLSDHDPIVGQFEDFY